MDHLEMEMLTIIMAWGGIFFLSSLHCFSYIQAKAMAGDNAVRSLLEKMTQCASNAYLGILERYNLQHPCLCF